MALGDRAAPVFALFAIGLAACSDASVCREVDNSPDCVEARVEQSVCPAPIDEVHTVQGVAQETVVLGGDTRMTQYQGVLPLSTSCSPAAREDGQGQYVVRYLAPQDADVEVRVSTANEGTDAQFDTVIELRRTCGEPDDSPTRQVCFDDVDSDRKHTEAFATVSAGQEIFILVTGKAAPNGSGEGAFELTIKTEHVSASPEIRSADFVWNPTTASGTVVSAGSVGVRVVATHRPGVSLRAVIATTNAEGEILEPEYSNFQVDAGWIELPMSESADAGVYEVRTNLWSHVVDESGLTVFVIDDDETRSTPVEVDLTPQAPRVAGEACTSSFDCAYGFSCLDVCLPSTALLQECEAADAYSLEGHFSDSSLEIDAAVGGSSCSDLTAGSCSIQRTACEAHYAFAVPTTGSYDVVFRTRTSTETGDTQLYVRSDCTNPLAEIGANDDVVPWLELNSLVEIVDIAHTRLDVFVESWDTSYATPFVLEAYLRPVLSLGDACDPEHELNRCGEGSCSEVNRTCESIE